MPRKLRLEFAVQCIISGSEQSFYTDLACSQTGGTGASARWVTEADHKPRVNHGSALALPSQLCSQHSVRRISDRSASDC